jgi:hypothetical protein
LELKAKFGEKPDFVNKVTNPTMYRQYYDDWHTAITTDHWEILRQHFRSPLVIEQGVNDIYRGFAVNNNFDRLKLSMTDRKYLNSLIGRKLGYFEYYYKRPLIEILKLVYFDYMLYKWAVTILYIFYLSKISDQDV